MLSCQINLKSCLGQALFDTRTYFSTAEERELVELDHLLVGKVMRLCL